MQPLSFYGRKTWEIGKINKVKLLKNMAASKASDRGKSASHQEMECELHHRFVTIEILGLVSVWQKCISGLHIYADRNILNQTSRLSWIGAVFSFDEILSINVVEQQSPNDSLMTQTSFFYYKDTTTNDINPS